MKQPPLPQRGRFSITMDTELDVIVRDSPQDHDIRWFTDFTGGCSTVGYAVALNLNASAQPLHCDRFVAGIREEQWLVV